MGPLTLKTKVKPAKDTLFRTLDQEAVMLNLSTGIYFGLDPVGTKIWHWIEEHGRLERVLESMLSEFEVSRETAEKDLFNLIQSLQKNELVEIVV